MSEVKHTAGPWIIEAADEHWSASHDGLGSTCYQHIASMATGQVVAMAVAHSPSLWKEPDTRANARLIAAAPELLEALRLYIEWCEAEEDHTKADFYQRMDMCRAAESAAKAAIAKAVPP